MLDSVWPYYEYKQFNRAGRNEFLRPRANLRKQRTKLWISGAKAEYMQNGRENPVDSYERFLPADSCCGLGKSFAQDLHP